MKRKLSFLFLSALAIPFFMVSCSDDKEEQEVKPATDLVVDNNNVYKRSERNVDSCG